MDGPRKTPGCLPLLAALLLRPAQAQSLAERKPWLVGLGAAVACLFLLFVLTLVYAAWCRESGDSNEEKNEETVEKEKEGEGNLGLELEEKEGLPNLERTDSTPM
ncbi:small integral membrane protein 24-like [Choloepus didactylus]|uniref:small integral membrane protein 24-like n=1 Tax=Choloepus didactylus TaxID=27675 RepID=UPI0018A0B9E3|nr:small integral membrane protein 24-like [Choloepus didactylus]